MVLPAYRAWSHPGHATANNATAANKVTIRPANDHRFQPLVKRGSMPNFWPAKSKKLRAIIGPATTAKKGMRRTMVMLKTQNVVQTTARHQRQPAELRK